MFLAVAWPASATAATTQHYSVLGRNVSSSVLTAAYEKVSSRYVVDLDSGERRDAGSIRASRIGGTVRLATGPRVWIRADDGRRVVIAGYRGGLPRTNEWISCMAVRPSSATISSRGSAREVISVPQYLDVTMTFQDFVGYVRNGYHFPEAPELGTQPGRRRLLSTERVRGSKVAEILQGRPTLPDVPPSWEAPERYDSHAPPP